MSENPAAEESYGDDFFEQILSNPSSYSSLVQSQPATSSPHNHLAFQPPFIPLGLSLDSALHEDTNGVPFPVKTERETVNMSNLFPAFEHLQSHSIHHNVPQFQQGFGSQLAQSTAVSVPNPPGTRPRVRARRGQATDPHSIAERLRRERIAERMRALQELVPSCNKTDRAAMLDEILDYVKFLRLQVKVLSMSRLGGAGAVAQLVADIPLSSVEGDSSEGEGNQEVWEKWSNIDIEQEVAKLMDENVGAAMQYLQAKGLCIMPTSLAALIYPNQAQEASTLHKPEPNVSA